MNPIRFTPLLILLALAIALTGCNERVVNPSSDESPHAPGSRRAGFGPTSGSTGSLDEVPNWDQFLDDIMAAIYPNRQALADSFITLLEESEDYGFPLTVETQAVYLYTGGGSAVAVAGDQNGWNPDNGPMTLIPGTNLFYRERDYELDARLDYKFVVDSNWILDPRNPRQVSGGYGPNSELAMPDYVDPPEIDTYPEVEQGSWDSFPFASDIMGRSYTVQVYLPVGYSDDQQYPLIYIHDGGEYRTLGSMGHVLDYCIHHQQIEPVIAVLVTPTNRNEEYWLNSDFKDMFVEELVPHIDATYATLPDASGRAVMGASLGGVTSVYFAHEHPDVFGYAGGHSSALWIDNEAMVDQIAADEPTDVVYYLDAGTYEPSIHGPSLALRDILQAKGNAVTFNEWHEGHSWGAWRAHTDNILIAFFAASAVRE